MSLDIWDLIVAIGLAVALEGLLYAAFPTAMKKMMLQIIGMPLRSLRSAGLVVAAIGIVIIWLARGGLG